MSDTIATLESSVVEVPAAQAQMDGDSSNSKPTHAVLLTEVHLGVTDTSLLTQTIPEESGSDLGSRGNTLAEEGADETYGQHPVGMSRKLTCRQRVCDPSSRKTCSALCLPVSYIALSICNLYLLLY